MTRRQFLKTTALTSTVLASSSWANTTLDLYSEKWLSLYNTHTGESLKTLYSIGGEYIPENLSAINHLLRDHRVNEILPIDSDVIDALYDLSQLLTVGQPLHIISGYRSPMTNEALRQNSTGVAKNSFHTKGMAVDFYIPGVELSVVREAALALGQGGVGYYPQSGFVHIDCGHLRQW